MAIELKRAHASEPFRWRLFLLVMIIMGSLTAGAIALTLMAIPSKSGVHAPAPEPVSRVMLPQILQLGQAGTLFRAAVIGARGAGDQHNRRDLPNISPRGHSGLFS